MSGQGTPPGGGADAGLAVRPREEVKKPDLYKVLLLNDDYTPMEFVVFVLQKFFGKGIEEAVRLMFDVHQGGVGICGVYTHEIAETKAMQVMECAKENEHPLRCVIEKE